MKNSAPGALWERALELLGPEIGPDNLELWLKPVAPQGFDGRLMMLKVPNKFFTEYIKDHYQRRLEEHLKVLTGGEVTLDYSVAKDLQAAPREPDPIEEARPQSEFKLRSEERRVGKECRL